MSQKVFSGNKNVDTKIINQLDDKELQIVCQMNKYVNSICKDDNFWMNRFVNRFGEYLGNSQEIKETYLGNMTWEEYYKFIVQNLNKGNLEMLLKGISAPAFDILFEIQRYNTGLLERYIEENDLSKVMELVENTDPILLNIDDGLFEADVEIAKYLISQGAMPDEETVNIAMENNNLELVKLFMNSNPDITFDGLYIFYGEELNEFIGEEIKQNKLSKDKLKRIWDIILE